MTPFFLTSDPVISLIQGIQKWVGVPITNRWDLATHEAFVARLSAIEGGKVTMPWGDVQGITAVIEHLLDPPTEARDWQLVAPLYKALGLPYESVQAYTNWVGGLSQQEIKAAEEALGRASDAILMAESAPPATVQAPQATQSVAQSAVQSAAQVAQPATQSATSVNTSSDSVGTASPQTDTSRLVNQVIADDAQQAAEQPDDEIPGMDQPAGPSPSANDVPVDDRVVVVTVPKKGWSTAAKVGVGLGAVAVAGIVGYLIWRRRKETT